MKSGVEVLAQHPGWRSKKAVKSSSNVPSATRRLAATLRSAASALERGRHTTAKKKLVSIVASQSEREANAALSAELAALHALQSACQVGLRDVPHQKQCQFFNASKPWIYRETCTCVRKPIADLEKTLADQLDCVEG